MEVITPIAGWFTVENPKIKLMIWGYPYFRKPLETRKYTSDDTSFQFRWAKLLPNQLDPNFWATFHCCCLHRIPSFLHDVALKHGQAAIDLLAALFLGATLNLVQACQQRMDLFFLYDLGNFSEETFGLEAGFYHPKNYGVFTSKLSLEHP